MSEQNEPVKRIKHIVIKPEFERTDDGKWIARMPGLGISATGPTQESAVKELHAAYQRAKSAAPEDFFARMLEIAQTAPPASWQVTDLSREEYEQMMSNRIEQLLEENDRPEEKDSPSEDRD